MRESGVRHIRGKSPPDTSSSWLLRAILVQTLFWNTLYICGVREIKYCTFWMHRFDILYRTSSASYRWWYSSTVDCCGITSAWEFGVFNFSILIGAKSRLSILARDWDLRKKAIAILGETLCTLVYHGGILVCVLCISDLVAIIPCLQGKPSPPWVSSLGGGIIPSQR